MTADEKPNQPTRTDRAKAADAERRKRLAAALRANLRRRKEQSRGRSEQDGSPDDDRQP